MGGVQGFLDLVYPPERVAAHEWLMRWSPLDSFQPGAPDEQFFFPGPRGFAR